MGLSEAGAEMDKTAVFIDHPSGEIVTPAILGIGGPMASYKDPILSILHGLISLVRVGLKACRP